MVLSDHGAIADKYINNIDALYDYIHIAKYVIMPNHIHMIIIIDDYIPDMVTKTYRRIYMTMKYIHIKKTGRREDVAPYRW